MARDRAALKKALDNGGWREAPPREPDHEPGVGENESQVDQLMHEIVAPPERAEQRYEVIRLA